MRATVLIVLALALAGCTSMLAGSRTESAGQPIGTDTRDATTVARDDQISQIIRDRFAADADLLSLSVDTRRGVVTLRGTLDDFDLRERAVRLAGDVPGVVRVASQITVRR